MTMGQAVSYNVYACEAMLHLYRQVTYYIIEAVKISQGHIRPAAAVPERTLVLDLQQPQCEETAGGCWVLIHPGPCNSNRMAVFILVTNRLTSSKQHQIQSTSALLLQQSLQDIDVFTVAQEPLVHKLAKGCFGIISIHRLISFFFFFFFFCSIELLCIAAMSRYENYQICLFTPDCHK